MNTKFNNNIRVFALAALFIVLSNSANAQVGVLEGNAGPDNSAMLHVQSYNKGLLIPRMTSAQREQITDPATGLMIFDTEYNGFWFFNGTSWVSMHADGSIVFELNDSIVRPGPGVDNAITDFVFGAPQTDWDGNEDHRARMFFDKSKGAFRVGFVESSEWNNNSVGLYSIALGHNLWAYGEGAVAAGGTGNAANAKYSAAVGGVQNSSYAKQCFIGGGFGNYATGENSFIGGGVDNYTASDNSAVLGGYENYALGENSVAGGMKAWAGHDKTFVWNLDYDNDNDPFFNTSAEKQFLVNAPGGFGINKNDPTSTLDVFGTATATDFVSKSEVSPHMNFIQVDAEDNISANWGVYGNFSTFSINNDLTGTAPFHVFGDATNNRIIVKGERVGIGDINPSSTLDVNGTATATAFIGDGSGLTNVPGDDLGDHIATSNVNLNNNWITNGTGNNGIYLDSNGTQTLKSAPFTSCLMMENLFPRMRFTQTDGTTTEQIWEVGLDDSNFYIDNADAETSPFKIGANAIDNRLVINGDKVGIGKSEPAKTLDVGGDAQLSTDDPELTFYEENSTSWTRKSAITTTMDGIEPLLPESPGQTGNQKMHFKVSNNANEGMTTVMTMTGSGNAGIGTVDPTEKLDVNGTIRIRGGGPSAGAVLTAMGNGGTATWVAPEAPETKMVKAYDLVSTHDGTDGAWDVVTTPALSVTEGDVIMINGLAAGKMQYGNSEDPFEVRIRIAGCGDDVYSAMRVYTPPSDGTSHVYPIALPTMAGYVAPCTGTLTFSYNVANTGDDAYDILNASIVAIRQ